MTYTWGEIQIISLQKMFLNNTTITVDDLETLREDTRYKLYLNAMPAIANAGLLRLMSVAKPSIRTYTISHYYDDEIYAYQSYDTNTITDEDLEIEGEEGQAYYFEIDNDATILIQEYTTTWTTIDTITHLSDVANGYQVVKGLVDNSSDNDIRLVFQAGDYTYHVKNIAIYNRSFPYDDDVLTNARKIKYDLKTLIDDFYNIVSVEYESLTEKGQFNSNYLLESDNTLVIDTEREGNYIIKYRAYPTKITTNTADTATIDMPSEVLALLPLYIVSELYKDDDISLSTQWRNQFEAEIDDIDKPSGKEEFADTKNWM